MTVITALADQSARDDAAQLINDTILLDAGAGTGKTKTLVDRVLHHVRVGTPITKLAIITFTKLAAAQLRVRIEHELDRAIRDLGTDSEIIDKLELAKRDLSLAVITTIDGFARRIVEANTLQLQIPPVVSVLAGAQATANRRRNYRVFQRLWLDDETHTEIVGRFFAFNIKFSRLGDIAEDLAQRWDRAAGDSPWTNTADLRTISARMRSTGLQLPLRGCFTDASFTLEALHNARTSAAQCRIADDKLVFELNRLIAQVEGVRLEQDVDRRIALTRQINLPADRPRKLGAKANWHEADLLAARGAQIELIEAIRREVQSLTHDVAHRLRDLLASFLLEDAASRIDKGQLEFRDLLVLANKAVASHASVHAGVRDQFASIMIDEFQDTDPLQYELALRIANDFSSAPDIATAEAGRLFIVGDPKQSIYSFRGADVSTFVNALRTAAHARRSLTTNFRSSAAVLNVINVIGEHLFPAESNAMQAAHEPLLARPEMISLDPAKYEQPALVVLGGEQDASTETVRQLEAQHVADWIERHLATTSVRANDIAIISPRRSGFASVAAELAKRGIAHQTIDGESLWQSETVQEVLTILRAVARPGDPLCVVGALRTAGFQLRDADLLAHVNNKGSWEVLRSSTSDTPTGAALLRLRQLHSKIRTLDPRAAISHVVAEFVVRERAVLEGVTTDVSRAIRLLDLVATIFADSEHDDDSFDLAGFVRWASNTRNVREFPSVPADPTTNAVRLLTIHAAKGLEFPVVIVTGLGGFSASHESAFFASASSINNRSLPWAEIKFTDIVATQYIRDSQEAAALLAENQEVRLLYVALTRAMNQLVLSTYRSSKRTSLASRLQRALDAAARRDDISISIHHEGHLLIDVPALEKQISPIDSVGSTTASNTQASIDVSAMAEVLRMPSAVSATALRDLAVTPHTTELIHDDAVVASRFDSAIIVADDNMLSRRGTAATVFGRVVHATLQFADPTDLENLDVLVRRVARAEQFTHGHADVIKTVRQVLQHPIIHDAATRGILRREVPINFVWHELSIEGIIDVLIQRDNEWLVIDYKTDQSAAPLDRYRTQLAVYVQGLRSIFPKAPPIRAALVFCSPSEARLEDLGDLSDSIAGLDAKILLRAALARATVNAAVSWQGDRSTA